MTGYALLLHAVNVGGQKIAMADLKKILVDLDFGSVATYLNSGNAVFSSQNADARALAAQIHRSILTTLGLDIRLQLRTADQLQQCVADNPLPEAEVDPAHLVLMFLDGPLAPAWRESITPERFPNELAADGPGGLYVWYRNGIGTSKLSVDVLNRSTKAHGTGRNWNTVRKLAALTLEREN